MRGREGSPAEGPSEEEEEAGSTQDTAVWNTIRDLHLELMYMYHRVSHKLTTLHTAAAAAGKAQKSSKRSANSTVAVSKIYPYL